MYFAIYLFIMCFVYLCLPPPPASPFLAHWFQGSSVKERVLSLCLPLVNSECLEHDLVQWMFSKWLLNEQMIILQIRELSLGETC